MISFERGDIDVRPSHAKSIRVFDFFRCITRLTHFFGNVGLAKSLDIQKYKKIFGCFLITPAINRFIRFFTKLEFETDPSLGGGAPGYARFKGVRKELLYIVNF